MFGHIAIQKRFIQHSLNQMAYYVQFTAPNNKLNVKSSQGYIWYHYSHLSVGVVGYDFELSSWSVFVCVGGGDRFHEMKRYVA